MTVLELLATRPDGYRSLLQCSAMKTTRVAVEIEMELNADHPLTTFGAALRALTERILVAPNSLASEGSAQGRAGAAKWTVRSWDQRDLTTCVSCKRMVPRAETDITENGERCQRCTDQGEVQQHWLNVEQNAYASGYSDGLFDGELDLRRR
jgi:hypothetical protein